MVLQGLVTSSNANVLSGSIFEFLKRPSRISVGLASSLAPAAGTNYTFQIGDTIVAQNAVIFGRGVVTTNGTGDPGPKFPDDFFIQNEPGLAGDRMVLSINVAGGTVTWCVIITEVA
jgi:hypothetical protein